MDPEDPHARAVDLVRLERGRFEITNTRGGTLRVGTGEDDDFTPVELLLAALAGCGSVNIDELTSRRAEPTRFAVRAGGRKVRDETGGRMADLELVFDLEFADGAEGDAARAILPRVLAQTRDRICTVSRTVHLGVPVGYRLADEPSAT